MKPLTIKLYSVAKENEKFMFCAELLKKALRIFVLGTIVLGIVSLVACSDENATDSNAVAPVAAIKTTDDKIFKKPIDKQVKKLVTSIRQVNGTYSVNKKTNQLSYHVSFQLGKPFETEMDAVLEYNHPATGEKRTLKQKLAAKMGKVQFKLDDMNCLKKDGDYPLNLRLFSESNEELKTTKVDSAITNFMSDSTLKVLGVKCNA